MATEVKDDTNELDITGEFGDTCERCTTVEDVIKHPKFEQFLRIWNRHRRKESGTRNDFRLFTVEDILSDRAVVEEAIFFFGDHLKIKGHISDFLKLDHIHYATYGQLLQLFGNDERDGNKEACTDRFDAFDPDTSWRCLHLH